MNFNQPQEELIELYIRGKLSPGDATAFEARIEADPELRQEVSFQQDLVRGIGDYRKAQLKARLDLIDVAPAPYATGYFGQSTLVKVASTAVVASLIGFGVYYFNQPSSEIVLPPVEIDSASSQQVVTNIPATPEIILEAPETGDKTSKKSTKTEESKKIVARVETKTPASAQEEEFTPVVNAPSLEEISESGFNAQKVEAPKVAESGTTSKSSEPIDIKTFEPTGKELKYKYFEGDLHLYGDFGKEPYEILEINSKTGREIYLYHASSYYKIEQTTDVKQLRPIYDERLVKDLTIIRTNKNE